MRGPATGVDPGDDSVALIGARRPTGTVSPVLFGRDDLVALAGRRLASAAAGSGELLLFAGEAGIGKTRLLHEVLDWARNEGFAVIVAGATPGDTEVAASVVIDLAAELRRDSATAQVGASIVARLDARHSGDELHQRRVLVTELADQIEAVANGPAVIALEDLHWADDVTLDVLARLTRRLPSLPLLVIGTYRSDELYPRVPMRSWRTRLLTQRLAEEAKLARLTSAEVAAMAGAIRGRALPAELSSQVFERSDGIPLHIEEFLATIDDVPQTLADAVLIRAEQLSTPARELAGAASVLGRSFDVDLLTAITGDSHEAVDVALQELAERYFVQPRGGDRSVYDFRHALIRDALYSVQPPHRRRQLHARVADAAAAAGLAHAFVSDHYERAGEADLAFGPALSAARAAAAISAHREAVELYRRVLRTMPASTQIADQATIQAALAAELVATDDNAAAAAAYEIAYELCSRLGDHAAAAALVPALVAVRHLLGVGLDERVAALRAALAMIDASTDPHASTDADAVRTELYAALAAAYMLDRRLDEAITAGEQARATQANDVAMQCTIDTTYGSVLVFAGRSEEGWRLLEDSTQRAATLRLEGQAARGYRMIGSSASVLVEYDRGTRWLSDGIAYAARAERFNDEHYMTAHLAHVLWATGDWDGAVTTAERALADGRGGITTRITALHVLGYVAMGRAEPDGQLAEAAALGAEMGELQRVSPAWWGLAERALLQGDADAALTWCERGYQESARVRDAAYLFPYVVTGTRSYLSLRDPSGAAEWLRRTGDLLAERGIPGTLGALDHAAGLIQLYEGQTGKARTALGRAAAFWATHGRFWEGSAALIDQARCAVRSRRPADAAALIADATSRYASVRAPLPAFAPRLDAEVTDLVLTAREFEVARLIATGATNREIGEALFIAPKTVAAHVEHILIKLGVSRRSQVAAWVAGHN